MKRVQFTDLALSALRKHRSDAAVIKAKIERYAETGAGNVKRLTGSRRLRLRVGEFRVLFEEDEHVIIVSDIGPRGSVYR
jgi:mRNA interferase RelE/StbE